MRALARWLVGLLAGLVVLIVGGAVASLTTLDRAPWWDRPPGRALRTLEAWPPEETVATGDLRAGFGRRRLSPTLGAPVDDGASGRFVSLPLAGYGARQGRPATGVMDDLWASAVAMEVGGATGVVVSADLLIIPHEVAEEACRRIARSCGIPRERVYFGASHTHASLGGWGEGAVAELFSGSFRPAVREWMSGQLADAAMDAVGDLSPSSAGTGEFQAPEWVRNRLVGDAGRVDSRFRVVAFRQADGDLGVVGSYAAHSAVLPASNMAYSVDYPGYWARALESSGVRLAMFLAGPVGSHAPRPPAGGVEGARGMGEALAARTRSQLADLAMTNRLAFGMASVVVPLPELQLRVGDRLRLRPWLGRAILMNRDEALLQGLRLGSSVWLSTPCDYSGELALELSEALRGRDLEVWVTSFNGDYLGYVVPSRYYDLPGYETRTMSFFGPQLPDAFSAVLRGMAERMASGTASRR